MLRAYRQGDVVVREAPTMTWDLEKATASVEYVQELMKREWRPKIEKCPKITGRNGHDHQIIPASSFTIIITVWDGFEIFGPFKLVHPEHGTMEIPHGIWSVYRIREWPERPRGD